MLNLPIVLRLAGEGFRGVDRGGNDDVTSLPAVDVLYRQTVSLTEGAQVAKIGALSLFIQSLRLLPSASLRRRWRFFATSSVATPADSQQIATIDCRLRRAHSPV